MKHNSKYISVILIILFVSVNIWQLKPFFCPKVLEEENMYSWDNCINFDIKCEQSKRKIVIDGWAFIPNERIDTYDIKVCLSKDGKQYVMKTDMVVRDDVREYFNLSREQRVKYSGYHAAAYKFNIPSGKYSIVLLYGNNGIKRKIDTGRYVEI